MSEICETCKDSGITKICKSKSETCEHYKQGCDWCHGNTFWDHDPDGEGVHIHVLGEERELLITSNTLCSDIEVEMPINFCPMCGKKLGGSTNE